MADAGASSPRFRRLLDKFPALPSLYFRYSYVGLPRGISPSVGLRFCVRFSIPGSTPAAAFRPRRQARRPFSFLAVMPAISFGATDAHPRTAEETQALARLAVDLQGIVGDAQVFRISNCFNHSDAILRYFEVVDVHTCADLVYSWGPIAALVSSLEGPQAADVTAWLMADADATFTWSNSADAARYAADKGRVVGRLIRVFQEALRLVRTEREGVAGVEEDTSLLPIQKDSCMQWNVQLYGYSYPPSELASSAVLGRLFRGFTSSIPVLSLEKIMAQNEAPSSDAFTVDPSSGIFTRKKPKAKISSVMDFFYRLGLLMNSWVFTGAAHSAPVADWSGGATFGKIGARRVQITRSGAQKYVERYRNFANKFADNVNYLVVFEYRVRKLVPDLFAEGVILEAALLQAFDGMRGEISAYQRKRPAQGETPLGKLPRRDGPPKPTSAFDKAKGAQGFDPSRRTCQKTEDGKQICKRHNDKADGGCKFGNNCKFEHACDVMVNGKACGSRDHHRLTHP